MPVRGLIHCATVIIPYDAEGDIVNDFFRVNTLRDESRVKLLEEFVTLIVLPLESLWPVDLSGSDCVELAHIAHADIIHLLRIAAEVIAIAELRLLGIEKVIYSCSNG